MVNRIKNFNVLLSTIEFKCTLWKYSLACIFSYWRLQPMATLWPSSIHCSIPTANLADSSCQFYNRPQLHNLSSDFMLISCHYYFCYLSHKSTQFIISPAVMNGSASFLSKPNTSLISLCPWWISFVSMHVTSLIYKTFIICTFWVRLYYGATAFTSLCLFSKYALGRDTWNF